MKHINLILIGLAAFISISAFGQIYSNSKALDLGWLELPQFTEDDNHFFVNHYTDESWGRQRNYSLMWDMEKQIATWVAYPMNKKLLGKGGRSGAWRYDTFVSSKKQPCLRMTYQAGNVEGYIRGHLCPSSDRLSPSMNQQTFFYTNIAPMDPYLNDGIWSALEKKVQKIAIAAENAWIVTGCIDCDESNYVTDINGKRIAVPEKFWKAILILDESAYPETDGYRAYAWIIENRSYGFSGFEEKLEALCVSVDELEAETGLDLFYYLVPIIGADADQIVER